MRNMYLDEPVALPKILNIAFRMCKHNVLGRGLYHGRITSFPLKSSEQRTGWGGAAANELLLLLLRREVRQKCQKMTIMIAGQVAVAVAVVAVTLPTILLPQQAANVRMQMM